MLSAGEINGAQWIKWMSIPEAIVLAVVLIAVTDLSPVIAVAGGVAYLIAMFGLAAWMGRTIEAQASDRELAESGLNPDEIPDSFKNL